jgi:hypothetical protein
LQKKLVYVGESINMPVRVKGHHRNGRPFDREFCIQVPPEDRKWVQNALIQALRPPQNRIAR